MLIAVEPPAEVPVRAAARAFGVVFGPSVVLDAIGGAAVATAIHALRRHRRPSRPVALACGLVSAYLAVGRPLMLHWGATCEELHKPLPGDDLVPDPVIQSTRAVTIEAPPEAVWPWLAQLGQDRAGFYSYEFLENLAGCEMHNADEIHPEWQEREPGDTVYLHPLNGLPVARFEPGRVLALENWGAFVLEPHGPGDSRLIARGRTPRGIGAFANTLLMEIPHFVMERKMLLGIKERAERTHTAALRRAMQSSPVDVIVHA
jgi:hypothetical protein